jgi:molybdopterin converting factor small subunit
MAEDEIRKHSKAVYETLSSRQKNWRHKLQDILVEILIIIFAVSVSIWFHNWSEELKDRKLEKEFLTGLRADLQSDLKEMKGDTAAYHVILNGALYFRRVGAGESLNADSLKNYNWIFFANVRKQARTNRFEALKSSGKLDIIENKALLANIISLYQEINPTITEGDREFTSYNINKIGTLIDSHSKLDTANNITNWLELFRNTQFRMALFRDNSIREIIRAYEEGINKCNEIILQIDSQTKE